MDPNISVSDSIEKIKVQYSVCKLTHIVLRL